MKPGLAFVESNTTGTGRLFARAAAQAGYQPVLLTADARRYPYVQSDGVAVVTVDTGRLELLENACREIREQRGLAGIGSSSEYFVAISAELARRFGLAGPDPGAIEGCRDKFRQRQRLRAAGHPTPEFRSCASLAEGELALAELGLPLVVKPRLGSGSVGVRLCKTGEEFTEHLRLLLSQTSNERGMPVAPCALVETVVPGREFSVELFDGQALGVVRKHLGAEPHFVEIGHDFPAPIPAAESTALRDEARRGAADLGLGWGPIHVELRLTPSGPVIIEVNPRLAGGFIPRLVELATGIDQIRLLIGRLAGSKEPFHASLNRAASIRFLVAGEPFHPERLALLAGLPHPVEVEMYPGRSPEARPVGDFRDRFGHLLAHAERSDQAVECVTEAHDLMCGRIVSRRA